jgi:hypothetical protein
MSEAVANVRWLIAAGIRDFQAMLDELGKLQMGLPRDAPAPRRAHPRRLGLPDRGHRPWILVGGTHATPAPRFVTGTPG